MESDDPPNIVFAHVGQRHIVALEEGQPGIIVLKIQRIPHPRRHLVDEAENALVPAGTVFIHQPLFKFQPQVFVNLLLYLQLPLLAVRLLDQQQDLLFFYIITIIKYILDLLSVHREQPVPRLDAHLPSNTPGLNGADLMLMCHRYSPCPGFVRLRFTVCPSVNRVSSKRTAPREQ